MPGRPNPNKVPHIKIVGFSTVANPKNANLDLVFVHGVQGDYKKTWTGHDSSRKAVFWPNLLSKHPSLASVRILTWGYECQVDDFFTVNGVVDLGNNLAEALNQERKDDPTRPLIFVAHSWGGIVVKSLLAQHTPSSMLFEILSTSSSENRQVCESTRGIVFIGTPHRAAKLSWEGLVVNFAEYLQAPSKRVEIMSHDWTGSTRDFFRNMQEDFLHILDSGRFQIYSFNGTQDKVVPESSAMVSDPQHTHETLVYINGNHLEICQFSVESDPGYELVFGAIEGFILKALDKGPARGT